MEKVLQVGLAVIKGILGRTTEALWDDLTEELIRQVMLAEEAWKAGTVFSRRKKVVDGVISWLSSKAKLTLIQKWLLSVILGYLVDALVAELNDLLGHNWAEKAEQYKDEIEELVPWLGAQKVG